ncbi:MAG: threonine synthase [Planctomycetota bacterium]
MARLVCPETGEEAAFGTLELESPSGGLYDVRHSFSSGITRELFDRRVAAPRAPGTSGVWRFRELVDPDLPSAAVVSLCEGNTPLYTSSPLSEYCCIERLWLKHEGANPTGSFKDRGMTVAVSRAVAAGAEVLACASTGNTAASLAAYSARAGVRAVILVPESSTAAGKLSQAVAYGARTLRVRGGFDVAMNLVRELARTGEVALLNSANPFRIEGQKTIVLEVLQQLAWDPPDWLVFPAGNLGNCAAFGKILRELVELGLIERVPRLAAVQAEGAAPFARAFAQDFARLIPVEPETLASAIRIGNPVSYARAVRSIRETDGTVLAVSDEDILDAKAAVDAAGLGAEPASCAALAGAKKLALRGVIDLGERVVCVLTGHLLKDPDTTLAYHEGRLGPAARANAPVIVEPDLEALRSAIGSTGTP